MKGHLVKTVVYTLLAMILLSSFGLVGCGGNNREISVEPAEEPTQEVIPTLEPTKEVIPTEEPTEEVPPTEEPTEEVIPTEEIVDLPPIMGTYSVAGLDPDYNEYEGTLEITASNGIFQWNWLDREPSGIGIYQGDVVSVIWGEKEKDCHVVLSYSIQEDGVLEGVLYEKGQTGLGDDKSTPQGEMGEGIEGKYQAFGNIGDGFTIYVADLDVARNGDVYDFHWVLLSGEQYYGVGIQRGNIVSVAMSAHEDNRCMVVSYLIEEDGTLDGIWAFIGDPELGTDVATLETSE
jgi:hypothetical protein